MLIQQFAGLLGELSSRTSNSQIAKELEISEMELQRLKLGQVEVRPNQLWKLSRVANKYGFFDVLPEYGMSPVSYDIASHFNLLSAPIGFEEEPPLVPLINRRTSIGGHHVDFPLGLPASVLAANSNWIEFYARRGFDILTYKTVRTAYRREHAWPNWVFIKDPEEVKIQPGDLEVVGYPDYWPQDSTTISMANSFGVPSMSPEWWQEDVRRAKEVIREGHQVLIVSVVASVNDSEEAMIADFVKAAILAKQAGADIVEANYSCPNVPGDPVGDVYQDIEKAGRISKAMREALSGTPLFVKIGYLTDIPLRRFVELNADFIDGIVAINTISAKVGNESGGPTFPGRPSAGLSGWMIKTRAQQVARTLVSMRDEVRIKRGKTLTILGVGGVTEAKDCYEYLDNIGVDGVESCTGAFLNPLLGLETRLDTEALKRKPSFVAFELDILRKSLGEFIRHPLSPSPIRADRQTGVVIVDR